MTNCRDCIHRRPGIGGLDYCRAPEAPQGRVFAHQMRLAGAPCGPSGSLHAVRQAPEQPTVTRRAA